MEVGTSVYYRSTECKTEEQKMGQGWERALELSPTIGKGLCVVNFFTGSDSGTRDNTVYVVAME